METLPIERLREVLVYLPETGELRWRTALSNKTPVGAVAGRVNDQGYRIIMIDGRNYRGHRIAWAMTYGEWPPFIVDHRDRNRLNNRPDNLRRASRSGNAQNRDDSTARGTSKRLGVCWDRSRGKWVARITINYKGVHLGRFDTEDEAAAAYLAAKQRLHPFGTLGAA